jgi:hypothetical protein
MVRVSNNSSETETPRRRDSKHWTSFDLKKEKAHGIEADNRTKFWGSSSWVEQGFALGLRSTKTVNCWLERPHNERYRNLDIIW